MAELFYTIESDQERLTVQIQHEELGPKRLLYRDTLKALAKGKDQELLSWLMKEELKRLNLTSLSHQADTVPFNRIRIVAGRSNEAIKLLGATGKLFWKGKKIFVDPFTRVEMLYAVSTLGEKLSVEGKIKYGSREVPLASCDWVFPGAPAWLIHEGTLLFFARDIDWKWIEPLLSGPQILEGAKKEQFCDRFEEGEFPGSPQLLWKDQFQSLSQEPLQGLPFLVLTDHSGGFADLWIDYGDGKKVAFHDQKAFPWRDPKQELFWEKDLLETDFTKKQVGSSHYYCPLDLVGKSLSFLLEIGWPLFDFRGKRVIRQGEAELSTQMEGDLVSVKGKVSYAEHETDLTDVLGAFNRREQFVDLSPHAVGLIDHAQVQTQWGDLTDLEIVQKKVVARRSQFALLDSFLQQEKSLSTLANAIKGAASITIAPPSASFQGVLHPYQQEGVNWLGFLHEWGFHGLLADEMGLGKTVQLLAFFSILPRSLPILVVMPTSLLFNWRRELEKFLPHESVYVHSGKERAIRPEDLGSRSIILTSYALLRLDAPLLQSLEFSCLILDEAQTIKNPESQVAKAAFQLRSKMRIAVTGTPIENRWEDLWSLFQFLMPDLLGDRKEFAAKMLAAQVDGRYLQALKKKIRPFILRRTKEIVADQLPEKEEQLVWVEMSDSQRNLYEEWLTKTRTGLIKKVESDGLSAHRMEVLEAILRLRQICCHPLLVDASVKGDPLELSAKMDRLVADLQAIVEEGHKVLVYSQFTEMLHLIEAQVQERGWSYVYLDGSTKDRETVCQKFQEDPSVQIFLVSLKAGGVGLNLTAADYVLLFDPWWNEAVERQAIDRAHRIGRKKSVIARRYITALSIEEKILALKEIKTSIGRSLMDEQQEMGLPIQTEDLYALLS